MEQNLNPKNKFHVEQPLSPNLRCEICGNNEFQTHLSCADHFLSKEIFTLYKCKSCHTLFTYPAPGQEKIFDYYKSENYVSHNDSKKGLINSLYQVVKIRSLKNKVKLVKSLLGNKPLLDYGCGTGDFLLTCVSNGIRSVGIEPDIDARKLAAQKNLTVLKSSDDLGNNESFGVITLWHVLEHTHHPMATLKQLSNHLSPEGYFIIALPNYESYDAQLYAQHWAAYDVPRHLFHFSKTSIQKLCDLTNLQLVSIIPMPYDAYYVSMLSEKYKGRITLMGILLGALSNLKAKKDNNFSSLIYILKK